MPVFRYKLQQLIILNEKDTQEPVFMSVASFVTNHTLFCSVLHTLSRALFVKDLHQASHTA